MFTTTQLKEYAELAQASYANFNNDYSSAAVEQRLLVPLNKPSAFTETQAQEFTARYEVLNQSIDDAASNGFSATLFRDKADPNHLILSFRGTEFGSNADTLRDFLLTDLQIGTDGYASPQALAMYRYIKQLTTAANQPVIYTTEELNKLKKVYLDQSLSTDASSSWLTYEVNMLADKMHSTLEEPTGNASLRAQAMVDMQNTYPMSNGMSAYLRLLGLTTQERAAAP